MFPRASVQKEGAGKGKEIMKQTRFTVLDLETTGLNPKTDKIIEIGAILVENGNVIGTYETLINPGCKLNEKVKELTNITDEQLKSAPYLEEVLDDFYAFADTECIMGHSILFDYSFLKRAFVNHGKTFERSGIDTLRIARCCLQELPKKNLNVLCEHFGIELKPHRALSDVMATYELYKRLEALFYEKYAELFVPMKLNYQVKKESPVTKKQLEQIRNLLIMHGLIDAYTDTKSMQYVNFEKMTRNEASRFIDSVILSHGRFPKEPLK